MGTDQHGHGAVVQDVVADAAEQSRAQRAAPARAHHHEVVLAVLEPAVRPGLAGTLLTTLSATRTHSLAQPLEARRSVSA
jgi:hypothetical protein